MVATRPLTTSSVDLTANARTVLDRRYLLRVDAGAIAETPGQLFARVAHAVAE